MKRKVKGKQKRGGAINDQNIVNVTLKLNEKRKKEQTAFCKRKERKGQRTKCKRKKNEGWRVYTGLVWYKMKEELERGH